MLTRVEVQSENSFFLEIQNARPTDSIRLEKIDGLDPPDIDIFMGDYARDGGFYGGRRVPFRPVTFTLSLNPKYVDGETTDGLRKKLYKAFLDPFATSDGLNVLLYDHVENTRYIQGHVEKFDGDLFSDDTTVQIVMRCPNPYIQDVDLTELEPSGPTFPFDYLGSAEAGLVAKAVIIVSSSQLVFDLNGTKLTLVGSFLVDDEVIIDTRRGQRKIQLVRTEASITTTYNILYMKTSDSTWLDLHSEDSILKVYGLDDDNIVANLTELAFRGAHWGI